MPRERVVAGNTLSNSIFVIQFGSKYHELHKEPLFCMPVLQIVDQIKYQILEKQYYES